MRHMRLIIISGFLGSGKTTFLIQIAKAATAKGLKVAILVNEVGEIGIDDQFMRQLDLNVWELLGGCICCSLAGGVAETLQKLEKQYRPDYVLLEPSGVADPKNVAMALDGYQSDSLAGVGKVALIDPLRLDMLMEVLTPLTTSTIKAADIILINKADAATPDELVYARQVVGEIKPAARLMTISVKEDTSPDLIEEILACPI
jgi:G3E family GTPase